MWQGPPVRRALDGWAAPCLAQGAARFCGRPASLQWSYCLRLAKAKPFGIEKKMLRYLRILIAQKIPMLMLLKC